MTIMFVNIVLRSGREISLYELLMSYTYAGLLEGRKSERANEQILRTLCQHASRLWKPAPFLILSQTRYLGDLSRELPRFTFVARFLSFRPIGNSNKNASNLVIIWLASELDPVLPGDVVKEIEAIDWDKLAENFDLVG